MGASLAFALDRVGHTVIGVEPDARARAFVASRLPHMTLDGTPGPAVRDADVLILAVPLAHLGDAADAVSPWLRPDAVVTDLTSVKVAAMAVLGERLAHHAVVGSHPMAGRASAGPWEASADLFVGRPWALVSDDRRKAPEGAVEMVAAIARAVGARPVAMAARAHDRAVAAVSHLPYLLSGALARAVAALAQDDPALASLIGPGLEGALRLSGQPAWMDDVCDANRASLGQALAAFDAALGAAADALAAGATLSDLGDAGRRARASLLGEGLADRERPFPSP